LSLSFSSGRAAFEIRWIVWALLGDNIAHHLEPDGPSGRFTNIHRVSEAVGGSPVSLPAAELYREATLIHDELLGRPVSDLAISATTRAVIHMRWPEVSGPASEVVGPLEIFGSLTSGAKTLGDVFGHAVSALREITAVAAEDGVVEVVDT